MNTNQKQKVLVVDNKQMLYAQAFKTYLRKFDADVYLSPHIPNHLERFDICILINELPGNFLKNEHWKKIIFIQVNAYKKAAHAAQYIRTHSYDHMKVVSVSDHDVTKTVIFEQIMWFCLSKSPEIFLNIPPSVVPHKPQHPPPPHTPHAPFWFRALQFLEKNAGRKQLAFMFILAILVYHVIFIIPFAIGSFYTYKGVQMLKHQNIQEANKLIDKSDAHILVSKKLYSMVRPAFLFFSIANIPDDLFSISDKVHITVKLSYTLQRESARFMHLFFKKNKSEKEKKETILLMTSMKDRVAQITDNLTFISQKIPNDLPAVKPYKETLVQSIYILTKVRRLLPYTLDIVSKKEEKKYLLIFANNMELRPGGGFIGSYGILTIKDLTFEGIQIFDVYDADGQLTAHVPPPDAIKKYLNLPHWFLRDSAFSPDFYENYNRALFFLEKEKNFADFSGGILITTTAIKNVLQAFGDIYLPDFKEKITKDNFYIKAQSYAENNFFPGSTQKKSFLSALTRQILVRLDTVSLPDLLSGLYKSFEEKQIALYLNDEPVQKVIDSLYWSGRIIEPRCPSTSNNCYADYLFPYDANLGVNKANFFMNRIMAVKVYIDAGGIVHSYLSIKFKNDSIQDIFPGGVYLNYFQLLIPRDSMVNSITIDNESLHEYDQEIGQFKKVGFFIEVPIQSSKEITVEYQSVLGFKKGASIYQLLFQKQIGSINNDLSLSITLPSNMFLINQNFSPLVKNNQIIYNTELSADKIFFIELLKE